MKTMQEELNELIKLSGKKFDDRLSLLFETKNSPEEREQLIKALNKKLKDSELEIQEIDKDISVKEKLAEVSEIISLSYISRQYFNKSRTWFYHKLNGNSVNGKESSFTPAELKTLDYALKDISKKIGSFSIV